MSNVMVSEVCTDDQLKGLLSAAVHPISIVTFHHHITDEDMEVMKEAYAKITDEVSGNDRADASLSLAMKNFRKGYDGMTLEEYAEGMGKTI